MPGVKTAISLDEELFNKVDKLAHKLHVSRSRVFTIAVQDYLKKQENQALLEQLNDAYGDHPIDEKSNISTSLNAKHRKIIKQKPW
jgi:metal-responsive CopG/Arc/MetJ family transcriptional regulator